MKKNIDKIMNVHYWLIDNDIYMLIFIIIFIIIFALCLSETFKAIINFNSVNCK